MLSAKQEEYHMTDTDKIVAATLAGAKLSAQTPHAEIRDYVDEYERFLKFFQEREKLRIDGTIAAFGENLRKGG
jgi:hypothetical protein